MYSKMPTKPKICIFFRFGLPTTDNEGKSGFKELISFLGRANMRAFHENPNRIHTELTLKAHNHKIYVFVVH